MIGADYSLSKILPAVAGLLWVCSAPARADPVIFVASPDAYAWWARENVVRPMAKQANGISTDAINAFQRRSRGMREPVDVCFIETVTAKSIVSADRDTQADIDKTLSEALNVFRDSYRLSDGTSFTVAVVAYEDCGEDGSAGTGLLITDSVGRLRGFMRNEFLFTRLSKRPDGVLDIFGCFACGDVSELRYDPEADLFYLRWVGH